MSLPVKRLKGQIEPEIKAIVVFNPVTQMWLVEWVDMTRTWVYYDDVKDSYGFRKILESMFTLRSCTCPEYIT